MAESQPASVTFSAAEAKASEALNSAVKNQNSITAKVRQEIADKYAEMGGNLDAVKDELSEVQQSAQEATDWLNAKGQGYIKAYPNWQKPDYLYATTSNNGEMRFSANGLGFWAPGSATDSDPVVAAIRSDGTINASMLDSSVIHAAIIESGTFYGALTVRDSTGSMQVSIGTDPPQNAYGTPDNGGRVIWVTSDSYDSMLSSGKVYVGQHNSSGAGNSVSLTPSSLNFSNTEGAVHWSNDGFSSSVLSLKPNVAYRDSGGKLHIKWQFFDGVDWETILTTDGTALTPTDWMEKYMSGNSSDLKTALLGSSKRNFIYTTDSDNAASDWLDNHIESRIKKYVKTSALK